MPSNIFGGNYWSADSRRDRISSLQGPSRGSRSDYAPGGRYGGLPLQPRSGRYAESDGIWRDGSRSRLPRLRSQPSIFLRDLDAPPPRFIEDRRDRYPRMEPWMDQYGQYDEHIGLGRMSHPSHGEHSELASYLGQSRSIPLAYEQRLLLENDLRNRDPHLEEAQGIPEFDPGYAAASLYPGTEYSLERFDRQGRPYRYRAPYVEDYESILGQALDGEGAEDDELRSLLGSVMGSDRGLMYPVRGLLESREDSGAS